ncbi:MAG: DNA replication/repair protein RecF [Legionellales bacterium]|nr:DNA replication/repair protein RecF [Legionellales bacterium]
MKFNKIIINNVRNIEQAILYPSSKFNFIFGPNGSGKTSILESLYYFGHARSFRSHIANRMIRQEQNMMTLFSELISSDELSITVGIQRDMAQNCKIHIQKQAAKNTAELATLLPIILINPDSFNLLSGGSKPRRALIDWGLFHVEHRYHSLWLKLQRCLKQRNMALKQRLPFEQISIWDEEFCVIAEEVDFARKHYCEQLYPKFKTIIDEVLPNNQVEYHYSRGWSKDKELKALLTDSYHQDTERGYSFYGPQRADLVLKTGSLPLLDFLSRGQQKAVVCALHIAQAELLHEQAKKESIFLLDDLPSELGMQYRNYLINSLNRLNAQVYLTSIEKEGLYEALVDKTVKMFHVEQGVLKEVDSTYIPKILQNANF